MLKNVDKLREVAELACKAAASLRLIRDRGLAESASLGLALAAKAELDEVITSLDPAVPTDGITVVETPCGNS